MIKGHWHAQGSAAQVEASLTVKDDTSFGVETSKGKSYTEKLSSLNVSDRLGKVERKVTLADGSIFATHDNDAIDALIKKHQGSTASGFVHKIESHMGWVIVALLVTVVFSFSFVKWGIPWTSKKIAHALPHETNQMIASNTLDFLDKLIFEESKLDPARMEEIRAHFKAKIAPLSIKEDSDIEYKLHFRLWGDEDESIPNALALPSGDIILTDKFVQLSKNQDEIDSVLLHEMGHVVHRHSLEMVVEGTFVAVISAMIVGDASGFADMGVGLGSILISSNYSRGHESEADLYAFEHMLIAKIDPQAFSDIMNRMTRYMTELSENKDDEANKDDSDKKSNNKTADKTVDKKRNNKNSIFDYLSSHPKTSRRVEIARQYSDCFKKGLSTCNVVLPDD